jgi:hypothetical protein
MYGVCAREWRESERKIKKNSKNLFKHSNYDNRFRKYFIINI